MPFDPQKAGDWGTFLGGVVALLTAAWAIIRWPYKTFMTQKQAYAIFVKKVEEDGTQMYVHSKEWSEMKDRFDKTINDNEEFKKSLRDWMARG